MALGFVLGISQGNVVYGLPMGAMLGVLIGAILMRDGEQL